MYKATTEQRGDSSVIRFQGELSIEHAQEIQETMLSASRDGGTLLIDMSAVTKIDLSFLQLICASHKSSIRSKRRIDFLSNNCAVLQEAASMAGYRKRNECTFASDNHCLWGGTAHE